MTEELAKMLAKRFIQRRDVKAVQLPDGEYMPDAEYLDGVRGREKPFMLSDIVDHINGTRTYGHYLLDADSNTRLFAFDIDLAKEGVWRRLPDPASLPELTDEQWAANVYSEYCNPREIWRDRAHPGRDWYKYKLRSLADRLTSAIWSVFDGQIKTCAAYSGNKGIHVYGFLPEPMDASLARLAAEAVLNSQGLFTQIAASQWVPADCEPTSIDGYFGINLEVFPKQDRLSGGGLGNLLRLPLGRNLKSSDPTFFIDQSSRSAALLVPHPDPLTLLKNGNPWGA